MQWNQAEEENIANHAEHSYNSLPLDSGSEKEDDETYENGGDGIDDEDLSGISAELIPGSGKLFFSPNKTFLSQPSSSKCSSFLMIQITKESIHIREELDK